jgi:hypothetical protein
MLVRHYKLIMINDDFDLKRSLNMRTLAEPSKCLWSSLSRLPPKPKKGDSTVRRQSPPALPVALSFQATVTDQALSFTRMYLLAQAHINASAPSDSIAQGFDDANTV